MGEETIALDLACCGEKHPEVVLASMSRPALDRGSLPPNRHGDKEFIVKMQNTFEPILSHLLTGEARRVEGARDRVPTPNQGTLFGEYTDTSIAVYDEPKAFWLVVDKGKSPGQHASLLKALLEFGRMPEGAPSHPLGRKVYLYARRVGGMLHVTVTGRVPDQQQRW